MIRIFVWVGLTAIVPAVVFAAEPAFQVADVHPSPHMSNPVMRGGYARADRYELRNATLLDLISRAYGIDASNVTGGPVWVEKDRFDVIAKMPAGTTPQEVNLMFRSLLADRFGLAIHNDTQSMTAYVLTEGKRPLLTQSDSNGAGGCEPQASDRSATTNGSLLCHNVTMAEFAHILQTYPGYAPLRSYVGANPVADMTGLKGSWDLHIKWTGRGMLNDVGSDAITLFDALDKQAGLKLELGKAPVPVIVIDSVNEKPTADLPGVTEKLPALPVEFEVADIRLSDQDKVTAPRFLPGGRLEVRGVTMIGLIQHAWGLDNYEGMIAGAPKWMDTERFDVVAKATPPGGPGGKLADDDSLQLMLRALLKDRFRLATHTEQQPVSVYALVAASPKLKKADPSNRPGCKYLGPVPGTLGAAQLRANNCQNVTMAQFADWLQGARTQARAFMDHPIVDATDLDSAWDFTFNFSGFTAFQVEPGSDPNGAIPLDQALEKQLGLKLELRKHPMSMLVIDHVEQKPTDN